MQTRFSQRLSMLMKERKISGQKIGDAVGKSQKTISRYATGEIEPSIEVKNAIYRAIADIGGNEEDAMTEAELDEREFFWKLSEEWMDKPECIEVQIGKEMMEERGNNAINLIKTFEMLSMGAKKYYLENFEVFHKVENWENAVLEYFHNLTSNKQQELVEFLENFNYKYRNLKNADKLAAYTKMIKEAENRPVLIVGKDKDRENINGGEQRLIEEYENNLNEIGMGNREGELPYYPWFLSYTPYDWYFLLRVQIYELYDKNVCLWNDTGIQLGVKLAYLLDAMR